ncbi:MAG: UDP-glucose 6-dehydrogenase [Candidatus Staskawiczbacteria bacterium RIFCSPLOWO2_01_FULL_38_12b]|uniref:UDP-glucose 6-dehydrogenase n=1 Tax=Candidatus Staskawiczbacteria bacterium RIFCSPLOWO2_01_FULL_38_12b TaxID=1802214 RepID=A0A1G2ICW7_9BACT|nr:MAG: UDP-glucose 6-dehydrogenase [Candidatus Staskawiczbacteria bacterium RIFCSPLOWO2_01_FULL_38_12b]
MSFKKEKICVIGAGYVGLVSGTCFAQIGHRVVCVDNNKEKIENLEKGILPIYEPGLEKMISKNKREGRLSFATSIAQGVGESNIIFIAVHTPTKENGETNLQYVEDVSREVARAMDKYKVLVSKSTMPVNTGQKIKEIITKYCPKGLAFDIVSNPEFLKEGTAIKDFLEPDRIVIGVESKKAEKIMRGIYKPIKSPIIFTSIESSEIIKHACNAFLATKISFINAIANICEKNSANVEEVAMAMGLDKRIGSDFLKAGIGFGGSCFPKDVDAFINVAKKSGYEFNLLKEVKKINKKQREIFLDNIIRHVPDIKGKNIAVWGLSFKPDTDDMREAPSVDIINGLIAQGAIVKAFDPVAIKKSKEIFKDEIMYCKDAKEALRDSVALVVLTEWGHFKKIKPEEIKKLMKFPRIFDGRNIFPLRKMADLGFDYHSIGKNKK